MNNIRYFVTKYLKQTFQKKLHEIRSFKFGPGMKYSLNTVQLNQYFGSKIVILHVNN